MKGILFVLSFLLSAPIWAGVKSQAFTYQQGKASYEGLLVYPDQLKEKYPAILMVHNWMGVTEETKKQAERMADLGFVVLAADIYGQGVRPASTAEAGTLSGSYKADRALFREHLKLGLDTLRQQKNVDAAAIFAVGYCFGGTGVLELARSGAELAGVVSFHGGLDSPTPADGANIKSRILVLHGADDPFVPASDLAAFENEMRTHKIDWRLFKYGNAVHSFTEVSAGNDPSTGAAYNELADKRSFEDFKDFAREVLGDL